MFESESDSADFFRAVWVLHREWVTNLAHFFQEEDQIGDCVAGAGLLGKKGLSYPVCLAAFRNRVSS